MDLKLFKEIYLLKPLQTIIIDRSCNLEEDDIHLLALTYKDSSYSLWTLTCLPHEMEVSDLIHDHLDETRREALKHNRMPMVRSIQSLQVGEHTFMFNGSSTESFFNYGNQGYNKLQYFLELGIEVPQWDHIPLSRLQLTEHRYSGTVPMVDIDITNKPIILKFSPYHKQAEVFHKYSLNFNLDEPEELTYFNPFEENQVSFYVYGFEQYTLEKFVQSMNDNDKYKEVPKEHIDQIISMLEKYFEDLKKKDSSLILMNYEADTSLLFHSTEYLDRRVDVSKNSSSESMGFIFKPDQKIGKHGKRMFIASFQEVPNDKLDTIEFELHSVSKQYKETTIVIKS